MRAQGPVTAFVCTLLTAAGFYSSIGLGEQWWIAWLAPVPVLWFAFSDTKGWQVFLAAWAAYALGATSIKAYGGILPLPVLVLFLGGPSVFFALAVLGDRFVQRKIAPLAGVLAFAALWAAFDFLESFNSAGGSVATPATAEVGMPVLAQSASLVGLWGITFSAWPRLRRDRTCRSDTQRTCGGDRGRCLRRQCRVRPDPHVGAPDASIRVALVNTDAMQRAVFSDNERDTAETVDAYAREIRALRGKGVKLVVLPEKLAIARAAWQPTLKAKLADAAREAGAVLVAGFDARDGDKSYNVSWAFSPAGNDPMIYTKRRLVPVLEQRYTVDPVRWRSPTARGSRSARTWISRP